MKLHKLSKKLPNMSTILGSTQIRSWGQTSWPLTLMKGDKEAAKSHITHPVLIPALTLFSHSAALLILSLSSATCPSSSFLPSLAVPLEKSVANCTELQWRMVGGHAVRRSRKEERGQFVHFYRDMWRVRREIYRERRAGGQWESGKNCAAGFFFVMTEEAKKGGVGFKKTKKRSRDKERSSSAQSGRNNETGAER